MKHITSSTCWPVVKARDTGGLTPLLRFDPPPSVAWAPDINKKIWYKCSFGECAFSYAGPVVWNNLPVYIRAEPDIARFMNILKTYFLDSHLIY